MFHWNPEKYGPEWARILPGELPDMLGRGRPRNELREALDAWTAERAFPPAPSDPAMARCCLAGLWLAYDFLEESHRLSQEVETATGSYWHAIMHRREGDFDNAKYWFRRVGRHPVLAALSAAGDAGSSGPAAWDPFRFVNACQAVARGQVEAGLDREACRSLSALEWGLLFDYSWRHAA